VRREPVSVSHLGGASTPQKGLEGIQKAISFHYRSAAWSYRDIGDRAHAKECIVKSFLANPLYFLSRGDHVKLFVRIMMGR